MSALHPISIARQPSMLWRQVARGGGAVSVVVLTFVTIGASPVLAAPFARSAAVPAASVPCSPTTTKIDGGPATNFCGPATATLTIGGKSYSFKNGYCQSISVSDITVDLALGTAAQGKNGLGAPGNGGKPYFNLDLSPKNLDLLGVVDSGGKKLTAGGSVSVTGTVSKSGASKGTFKSAKGAFDLSGKPFSVSGSWNCHGTFAKN